VTGRLVSSPGVFLRCEACGHTSFVSQDDPTPAAPRVCPQCGSHRVRAVGTSTASDHVAYYQCDACRHLQACEQIV
jgi:hypothetical protein